MKWIDINININRINVSMLKYNNMYAETFIPVVYIHIRRLFLLIYLTILYETYL